MSYSFLPLKGKVPVNITNNITPHAQISHEDATAFSALDIASGGT